MAHAPVLPLNYLYLFLDAFLIPGSTVTQWDGTVSTFREDSGIQTSSPNADQVKLTLAHTAMWAGLSPSTCSPPIIIPFPGGFWCPLHAQSLYGMFWSAFLGRFQRPSIIFPILIGHDDLGTHSYVAGLNWFSLLSSNRVT